jgi:putative transcriptional regulator
MSIHHHLDDSTLMSFAAGSLPEALSVVAAAHIAACGQCKRELLRMELIGSALFSGLAPTALRRAAPTLALAGAEADVESAPPTSTPAMPGPLSALIGAGVSDIKWSRLGVGVWQHRVALSGAKSGDLRLLKISAGRRMPNHGHGGSELTFIIDGAYTDKTGTYRVGDIADHGDELEHVPIACPVLGCICVVAADRPARFKAVMQKMLQPLTGM